MAFDSDRTVRADAVRAQMQTTSIPNAKVTETDFAFLIQRADVPKDFKGIISTVYELGSVALKPYLDPISARLDEIEVNAALFEEADSVALEALDTAKTELEAAIADRVTTSQLATELKVVTDAIANLDQSKADKTSVTALNTAIDGLNDLLTANDATDADIQVQLDKVSQAVEDAKTASGKSLAALSDEITQIKADLSSLSVVEKDPIATASVAKLQTVVDDLPTDADLDPIKASVKTAQGQLSQLDTSKANKADLDAAQAAIKALQDALAALPPSGATPEQLAAIDARVKALESVLSTSENSKGILIQDVRSHFLIAGNLFGGVRRLVDTDISRLNQRAGYEAENPYRALNGSGQTGMTNASNQWLTWFTKTTMRLWRIELTHINNNWAVRNFKRNGTQILNLVDSSGTYTAIYTPKASTGHESFISQQFVDDGGNTVISNLHTSVTDSANPAAAPVIAGTTLKVGERFRFQTVDGVSALFAYQGTDAASGSWWAKPVKATADSNIALHTEVDPIFNAHKTAIEALEAQLPESGNTRIRREPRSPQEDEILGDWDIWIRWENNITSAIYQEYKWAGSNIAVTDGPHTIPLTYTEAQAKYDTSSKLYTVPIGGLDFQYTKEAVSQVGQTSLPVPCFANQFPNAGLKFSNIRYEAYNDVMGGTVIANGGFIPRVDAENLTAIQFSSFIKRIVYYLTPLSGDSDVIFEIKI